MKKPTEHFVSIVREYCTWAEDSKLTGEEDLKKAISLLALLYFSALALQNDGCGEDINATVVTNEQWQFVYKRFSSLPFNYYSSFFSPAKIEDAPGVGDVADDLADIYRDIKDGLWLYEKGYNIEAVWEWKQSFSTHWGRHAVGALQAFHCYLADEYVEI